jgi:hypothetical protein
MPINNKLQFPIVIYSMKVYNNLFASFYRMHTIYSENVFAPFRFFIVWCQAILCLMVVRLFFFIFYLDLSKYRYVIILGVITWFGLISNYYTRDKCMDIIIEYNKKPLRDRNIWTAIAWFCFCLPIIFFLIGNYVAHHKLP